MILLLLMVVLVVNVILFFKESHLSVDNVDRVMEHNKDKIYIKENIELIRVPKYFRGRLEGYTLSFYIDGELAEEKEYRLPQLSYEESIVKFRDPWNKGISRILKRKSLEHKTFIKMESSRKNKEDREEMRRLADKFTRR